MSKTYNFKKFKISKIRKIENFKIRKFKIEILIHLFTKVHKTQKLAIIITCYHMLEPHNCTI